jgi:DNA mismatch repair protein MutS
MAGKSTFIRSCAIVYLLAQLGCYVPAERAKIQLVDGIYSRVGASDNLTQNESTFMVEMVEMAYILNNSSSKSLVVLDEVGRGTSTYDGLSLAWAITEEMSQKTNAKTLFATHYHELTALEHTLTGVKNFYVEAIAREKLFFTHKVKPGSLNKSFGVEVAKMAGVEQSIISRAKEVLEVLEAENDVKSIAQTDLNYSQLGLLSQIPSARDTEKVKESVSKEVDQNKTAIEQQKLKIIADLEDLQLEKISPIELFAKITDIKKELDKLDN